MRPATAALTSFLGSWSPETGADVTDLYVFYLLTGEVFYYSGYQAPLAAPPPGVDGRRTTNGATAIGNNILHFASVPSWIWNGLRIANVTHPTSIPAGTFVTAVGTTTVTMSQNAASVVSNGDTIQFTGYFPLGPPFGRSKLKSRVGPQIDELEIDVFAGQSDFLGFAAGGSMTWQSAAWWGLFDGAYIRLIRCYLQFPLNPTPPPAPTVVGTTTWFYGRVADIEIGRTRVKIMVRNLLDLLTRQMPYRLFQSGCNFIFGGKLCGYDRVGGKNFLGTATGIGAQNLTCQGGSTQNTIFVSFTPPVAGSYNNGNITGTSGLNNGYTRTITFLTPGSPSQIAILKPFAFPVVAGTDTFQLLPGCDHTFQTCLNTFKNTSADGSNGPTIPNMYGGFPYIPPPESAV